MIKLDLYLEPACLKYFVSHLEYSDSGPMKMPRIKDGLKEVIQLLLEERDVNEEYQYPQEYDKLQILFSTDRPVTGLDIPNRLIVIPPLKMKLLNQHIKALMRYELNFQIDNRVENGACYKHTHELLREFILSNSHIIDPELWDKWGFNKANSPTKLRRAYKRLIKTTKRPPLLVSGVTYVRRIDGTLPFQTIRMVIRDFKWRYGLTEDDLSEDALVKQDYRRRVRRKDNIKRSKKSKKISLKTSRRNG